jgi:hypothetical protein
MMMSSTLACRSRGAATGVRPATPTSQDLKHDHERGQPANHDGGLRQKLVHGEFLRVRSSL